LDYIFYYSEILFNVEAFLVSFAKR